MKKAVFVISVFFALQAKAGNYDFMAVCNKSLEYTSIPFISHHIEPAQWLEYLDEKREPMYEDWLGPYEYYKKQNLELIYTRASEDSHHRTIWIATYKGGLVPREIATKKDVMKIFGVSSINEDELSMGCDCQKMTLNFLNNKTQKIEIDFTPCY